MFTVDVKSAKDMFFDRRAVFDAVDAATRKVFSKFGAFVRTRAKSSIRSNKKVSLPGGPPNSHVGTLKRFIYFAYEKSEKAVYIGPVMVGGTASRDTLPNLEFGGTEHGNGREIFISNAVGRDTKGRYTSGGKTRVVLKGTIKYKARPYMGPAFRAELSGLPAQWQNSVRSH